MIKKNTTWYKVKEMINEMEIGQRCYKDDFFRRTNSEYNKRQTSVCIRTLERLGVVKQSGFSWYSDVTKIANIPLDINLLEAKNICKSNDELAIKRIIRIKYLESKIK